MLSSVSITNRINLGSAAITALLIVVASFSLFAVRDLGGSYKEYRSTAKQNIAISDFVEDLFQARIAALKFREVRSSENADEVQSNIAEIIRDGNDLTVFEGNRHYSEEIRKVVVASEKYMEHFQRLRVEVELEESLENSLLEAGRTARESLTGLNGA
ncbi:hypothetical protein VWX35_02045, partial [Phaeobacter sp. A36a-5a]